jgi:hypothetical protein
LAEVLAAAAVAVIRVEVLAAHVLLEEAQEVVPVHSLFHMNHVVAEVMLMVMHP